MDFIITKTKMFGYKPKLIHEAINFIEAQKLLKIELINLCKNNNINSKSDSNKLTYKELELFNELKNIDNKEFNQFTFNDISYQIIKTKRALEAQNNEYVWFFFNWYAHFIRIGSH